MVLEFSVPAAVVGMMWVSIYKGDSSITLSLLVIDTVLAPLIIPLTLKILVGARVKMNPEEMMKDLVFMIGLKIYRENFEIRLLELEKEVQKLKSERKMAGKAGILVKAVPDILCDL